MNENKKIEYYLNGKVRDEHSIKHYGFTKTLKELYGNSTDLKKIYVSEIPRVEKFRSELADSLTPNKEKQSEVAVKWVDFLKPRIDVLEFWSTLFTSFVGIMAAGATIFTVIGLAVNGEKPALEIGTFAILTTIFVVLKFSVDKKKLWYKYISSHLDVISKVKPTA
jgi:hypothetical protein